MKNNYHNEFIYLIENKLQWGESEKWKERHYNMLSKKIADETGIAISNNTLKRFFGKLKTSEDYLPQTITLDALAKYLGYGNWIKFEEYIEKNGFTYKHINNEIIENKTINTKFKQKKKLTIPFILISIVLLSTILYFINTNLNSDNFTFTADPEIGTAPVSVRFNYDISRLNKNIYIDYANENFSSIKGKIILNKKSNITTHYYPYSGYYKVKLYQEDKIIDHINIFLKPTCWERIISNKVNDDKNKIKLTSICLNNKTDFNGTLKIDKKEISSFNIDTNQYYQATYRYGTDFDISINNMRFETRLKSIFETYELGFCNYIRIILVFEKDDIDINLPSTNCFSKSKLTFAQTEFNGNNKDLSKLGHNWKEWTNITIETLETNCQIKYNEDIVFSSSFISSDLNNKLKYIRIQFVPELGEIDFVKISNLKTNAIIYTEDFKN